MFQTSARIRFASISTTLAVSNMRYAGIILSMGILSLIAEASAQIPITGTGPVIENFDGIPSTNPAPLPSGWKLSAPGAGATAGWSDAGNVLELNRIQDWYGNIPAAGGVLWAGRSPSSDRSIGFYTSGAFASPNAVMARFRNETGAIITSATVSYRGERRVTRTDSQQFTGTSFALFYSTDGMTWIPLPDAGYGVWNSYYQSAVPNSSSVIDAPTRTANLNGLIVFPGGSIFLKWQINSLSSGYHWGFGMDEVNFQVTGTADVPHRYWLGDDTTRGGSGTWTDSGGTAWAEEDADGGPGVPWDAGKTAVFGGNEPSTVTVSGTVNVNAGMIFLQPGSSVGGGTAINLGGASQAENLITTGDTQIDDGVTAILATPLAGTSGVSKDGKGNLFLAVPMSYSGGTHLIDGSVIVPASGSLGSGPVRVDATSILLLEHNQALPDEDTLRIDSDGGQFGQVTLNFASGSEVVGALEFDGVPQAEGTWGATGSGAQYIDDERFAGTGILRVGPLQALHWLGDDTTRGGAGTWSNSAGTPWAEDDADGGPGVGWDSSLTAIFGGNEPSTVTLSGTVEANAGIEFRQPGSSIGGGTALHLGGATRADNLITTTESQAADGISAIIAAPITGSTGLTKSGPGNLFLVVPMSYTGGTRVAAGSLILSPGASVEGEVTLDPGAILLLDHNQALSDAATVRLASGGGSWGQVNLNFSYGVQETVAALELDGIPQPEGTYGASGSGAENVDDQFFAGTGLLRVGSPPPPANALFWVGDDVNRGGSGSWTNAGGTAWSIIDADIPGTSWDPGKTAVFGGSQASMVTVSGEVAVNRGMRFQRTGSTVQGGSIFLGGATQAANLVEADAGVAGTIESTLTGPAGLTKAGAGRVILSGNMAYSGGTLVTEGTLVLSTLGELSSTEIVVTPATGDGATLLLENAAALPDNAVVRLSSGGGATGKVHLDFSGAEEEVDSLYLDGVVQAEGSWGATGSGAENTNDLFFTGPGILRVGDPPTPSLTGFAAYAQNRGLSGDPGVDFDRDGLADALEYVLGTDPRVANADPTSHERDENGNLIFRFPRDDSSETSDVSVSVLAGIDLENWPMNFAVGADTASSAPEVTVVENGAAPDEITVTIPDQGQDRLFACLDILIATPAN